MKRSTLFRTALLGLAFTVAGPTVSAFGEEAAQLKVVERKETIPGTEVTFEMVSIPGGTFKMGSPESEKTREDDEGPQIEVKIDPFFMGKYEVTWAEYEEFLQNYSRIWENAPVDPKNPEGRILPKIPQDKFAAAVLYPTPLYEQDAGPILANMGRGGKYPAVIMSQFAARQYTKWLSKKTGRFYRLPTEAEWEYAARAGTTTAYFFGDDPKPLDDYAIHYDIAPTDNAPDGAYRVVGSKKPNPWGLYDMLGNVSEWTLDAYDKDWYKQFEGKTVSWHEVINWPKAMHPRVFRGGGWESDADELRVGRRLHSDNNMNKQDPQIPKSPYWLSEGFALGFRIVSPEKEPSEEEKKRYWDIDDPSTERIINISRQDRQIREVVEPPAKQ